MPEVRVMANALTLIRFDASIDRASMELEGRTTRFRLVDVGDHTLVLEMAVEPGDGEKLGVRVRYKDGGSPAYAAFALVSHPRLVDREVEVVRRPRSLEALEAALAEKEAQLVALRTALKPAGLVFSGRLGLEGVQARPIGAVPANAQNEVGVLNGAAYRASTWALAVIRVRNLPGQPAWMPGRARLTRADGTSVKVLSVDMNKAQLAPGEEGLVAVESEAPFWKKGEVFLLELLDRSGAQRLSIPDVKL
ncbi:Hypothetical protein AA314_00356 [Archangium gephyra]|uniref:DUF2381 family protein n=1 Tax=Archangium gephyra TaxID=48 RepID=A0AAC8Q0E1_9BACT|nr:Hypothetical protein AA314_00356 [Archangium gephyra]